MVPKKFFYKTYKHKKKNQHKKKKKKMRLKTLTKARRKKRQQNKDNPSRNELGSYSQWAVLLATSERVDMRKDLTPRLQYIKLQSWSTLPPKFWSWLEMPREITRHLE